MPHSQHTRRGFLFTLVSSSCLITAGCGTLMYPERQGQGRHGPLDWKVVLLDGIGLLLFFIPGVIAFGVDWYNGTLFLPSGYGSTGKASPKLTRIQIPQQDRNIRGLERILSEHLGRDIRLEDEDCVTMPVDNLDQCDSIVSDLASNQFQASEQEFIVRCQSPD